MPFVFHTTRDGFREMAAHAARMHKELQHMQQAMENARDGFPIAHSERCAPALAAAMRALEEFRREVNC